MNTRTLKPTAVALLIGLVGAPYVLADLTGNQTLGSSPEAMDTFILDCPNMTNNVRARVSDLTNNDNNTAANLIVQVIGPSGTARMRTDVAGDSGTGEGGSSSSWTARIGDGLGPYDVTFEKDASGTEYYTGEALCYDDDDDELGGEDLDRTQNQ